MRLYGLVALCAVGCAPDLVPDGETDTDTDTDVVVESLITASDGEVTVNATDYENWAYFQLDEGVEVWPGEAESSLDWDLGFKRFNVKVNGGISGTGDMGVAVLPEEDYDTLTVAPADGYITDEEDADDDGVPELAFQGWYDYDMQTHLLSPADIVYVVRSVDGEHYKIRFENYYDDAGSPAMVRFSLDVVDNP